MFLPCVGSRAPSGGILILFFSIIVISTAANELPCQPPPRNAAVL